jgi:hypothetical protein
MTYKTVHDCIAERLRRRWLTKCQEKLMERDHCQPIRAVGIELVAQSLSLAESTALTLLHPSNTPLEPPILDTSWPRNKMLRRRSILSTESTEIRW